MSNSSKHFEYFPVLGNVGTGIWVQSIQKTITNGQIFAVIGVKDGKKDLGKSIITLLTSLEFVVPDELNISLSNALTQDLIKDVSFSLVCILEKTSYIWTFGEGYVFVRRNNKIGTIGHSQQLKVVCGPLKQNDVCILTTKDFIEHFNQPFVNINDDVEMTSLQYTTRLQEASDTLAVCAMYVKVGEVITLKNVQSEISAKEKANLPEEVISSDKKITYGSGKLTKKFIQFIISRIKQRKIVIHSENKKTVVKKVVIIGIVACAIIILFILVSKYLQNNAMKRKDALLSQYSQMLDSYKIQSSVDKNQARQQVESLLLQVQSKIQEYPNNSFEKKTYQQFYTSTQEYFQSISAQKSLDNLSTFYDFRLMKSDFIGKSAVIDKTMAYYLDPEGKTIISVDTVSKQSSSISLENIAAPKDLTIMNGSIYVLSEDGVFLVSPKGETRKVIEKDDAWKQPSLITSFGTNIYVLDKEAKQIYKYSSQDVTSFNKAVSWVRSSQGFDISLAQNMCVDGKVWISSGDGQLGVFASGSREQFSVNGLTEQLSSQLFVYTHENGNNVYILEPTSQRLIVSQKNKELVSVIKSKQFAGATSILVNEDQKKAYIGVGSIVYEVSL